jgi:YD repeat-containing protein
MDNNMEMIKEETVVTKKKIAKRQYLIMAVVALVAVAIICIIITTVMSQSESRQLAKQLDLGQKYLEDMDYDQAILAFNKAIEIDPKNVEAYLGMARAYEGLDNLEMAIYICTQGYEKTSDERLLEKMQYYKNIVETGNENVVIEDENEITSDTNSNGNEIIARANLRLEEDYKDIGTVSSIDYLTYKQLEEIFNPYINALEEYVNAYKEVYGDEAFKYIRENHNVNEVSVMDTLPYLYRLSKQLDKCLEIRKQIYEATGLEDYNINHNYYYSYENSEEEYDVYGISVEQEYDTYGRLIWLKHTYTDSISEDKLEYDEKGNCIRLYESDAAGSRDIIYTYDEEGRIVERKTIWSYGAVWIYTYEYTDNGFVEYSDTGETNQYIFTDDYRNVELVTE